MIHIPESAIEDKVLKDSELRTIEAKILLKDFAGASPVKIRGSSSFCEQQPWI